MRGCNADGDLDDAQYSKPLPWIGLYVAAASLLCAAAMAFDAYSGFRRRKFWFPSRLFSLNATTLTLLGVATKFPVDLNTSMPGRADQLTKLSGTVLICITTGNLMPSLGAMDDSDMLSNVVALGILVVTVAANIGIQMGTGVIYAFLPEHAVVMLLMVVLLVILVSSALAVSTTKQLLEKQYDSKYAHASDDEQGGGADNKIYPLTKLKKDVKKYWLMAHTCSPQYVLGRSATCTASGAFCLLAAGVLVEALLRALFNGSHVRFCTGTSDYQWSTTLVLVAQTVAVLVGTIAPACRWFNAVGSWSNKGRSFSCRDEFKVEKYWVQRLNEWKEAPLPFQISRRWSRKTAHKLKNSVTAALMWLQKGVVLVSKLVRFASISILPVSWLHKGGRFRKLKSSTSYSHDENVKLKDYVLYLEGEEGLVDLITRSERRDTEKWIEKGQKKQPTTLLELINKHSTVSEGFKQVGTFDSKSIPSLLPQEPPNCWALPVVTLVTVATTLTCIDQNRVRSLQRGVSECLRYVRLIEKNLDEKGLVNMRAAADKVWLSVDLYNKWFDVDLHKLVLRDKNGRKVIEKLRDIAKGRILEFVKKRDFEIEANKSPLEWPEEVLAANCMYRVCATILQDYDCKHQTDGNLFEWIRRTTSDILGACLTNLPRVIHMECFCSSIEVREVRVRDAAFLLGEAEQVLGILENPKVTCLFPDKKQYIDDWQEGNQMGPSSSSHPSTSSNKLSNCTSDELCLSID